MIERRIVDRSVTKRPVADRQVASPPIVDQPVTLLREETLASGLRLMQKRYGAGLRMARHAHDGWRFCLALAGSYTDSWRRGHRTRAPWQLSLHPAGEVHTSVFHETTRCFHIEFGDEWQSRLLGEAGIAPEPHEFLDGQVPLIARRVYDEFRRLDACSPLVIEGLACELIGVSARGQRRDGSRAAHVPTWIEEARDLLHDRFNEPLRLRDVAADVGVHPIHLARHFRRHLGCGVGEYLRRLRVDFACRQLSAGAALSDIAFEAGFVDQSHLTRVFKRIVGCTPGEYRAHR
jgi:AraC family transcriptional regulator